MGLHVAETSEVFGRKTFPSVQRRSPAKR